MKVFSMFGQQSDAAGQGKTRISIGHTKNRHWSNNRSS